MAVAHQPRLTSNPTAGKEIDDIHMHTIIEQVESTNGHSNIAPVEKEEQTDDILDTYDEDSVVVIDLTEERNSSSKFRSAQTGSDMTASEDKGGQMGGRGSAQPKLGELSLHEVRYENYVDEETNETIEIKRQVYYDDSDLISPPEEEEQDSPVKQNGGRPDDHEFDHEDIVAPPSQFSTSSNFSDTTSEENTQIVVADEEPSIGAGNPLTDEEIDRLFRQASMTTQTESLTIDDSEEDYVKSVEATENCHLPSVDKIVRPSHHHRPSRILNESELTWLNYQKYSMEEEQENTAASAAAQNHLGDFTLADHSAIDSLSSSSEVSSTARKPSEVPLANSSIQLPPVRPPTSSKPLLGQTTSAPLSAPNTSSSQSCDQHELRQLPPLRTPGGHDRPFPPAHPPRLPSLSTGTSSSGGANNFSSFEGPSIDVLRRPASADTLDDRSSDDRHHLNGASVKADGGGDVQATLTSSSKCRRSRSRKKGKKSSTGDCSEDSGGSGFWKRPKSTTGTRLESMVTSTGSVTTTGTLGRAPRRGHRRGFGGPVLRAKSNDFLDNMVDVSYASTLMTSTLSQSSLVTKMTRIERHLYLGSLEAATDVILLESHGITHIVSVDSVPLPRKMTSMLPRIALLHLQVTDLPDEDLLSHFTTALDFIEDCIERQGGSCLVHCLRGRSRSATVVAAYLMRKHSYSAEKALRKIKGKRPSINPHTSFKAQLKLYQDMGYQIDPSNIQLKMFRLHCASERMRKAKILFRDSLNIVLDDDPASGGPSSTDPAGVMTSSGAFSNLSGSVATSVCQQGSGGSAKSHPMQYKCKRCRRILATAFNLLPHCSGESPDWLDPKWAALPAEEVLEGASDTGLSLCHSSLFINPVRWMANEIKGKLSGRLYCPHCQAKVGNYSWVLGRDCDGRAGCGATVAPAFQLDVTEIIFKTKNKYLQNTGREPIVV